MRETETKTGYRTLASVTNPRLFSNGKKTGKSVVKKLTKSWDQLPGRWLRPAALSKLGGAAVRLLAHKRETAGRQPCARGTTGKQRKGKGKKGTPSQANAR